MMCHDAELTVEDYPLNFPRHTLEGIRDAAQGLPISVKTVLVCRRHALLLRQPDGRWELPGGRLEADDDGIVECLLREVQEETGLEPQLRGLLNSWVRNKPDGSSRFVITFLSHADIVPERASVRLSAEHDQARFVGRDDDLPAPLLDGYAQAVRLGLTALAGPPGAGGR